MKEEGSRDHKLLPSAFYLLPILGGLRPPPPYEVLSFEC
ncbi:hypothetical protein DBT_0859 [Dissulfuribacter thermophilus]|uniref:Uncharacterized protein n=1 Tax=Dissulfuribacter thermophilus TaxID=1156395 RepID=A0A1B9F7W1_9BACT|nr:hypothetical protein DBT_0859 [Dissulfuribacter thermophilus]